MIYSDTRILFSITVQVYKAMVGAGRPSSLSAVAICSVESFSLSLNTFRKLDLTVLY